ncbi:MAG: BrnT family toxin [Deltaproteobacteria bacterium]|nr:BrnT family toxin [Deltaproteobacteria bacterium]
MIIFEWDEKKAEQNIRKHSVFFEEAATVFSDPFSITIYDPLHSKDEDRFVILGMSENNSLLVVIHTERGDKIRIISARKATKKERRQYESNEG